MTTVIGGGEKAVLWNPYFALHDFDGEGKKGGE